MENVMPEPSFGGDAVAATKLLRRGHDARRRRAFAEAAASFKDATADPAYALIAWNDFAASLAAQGLNDEALAAWRNCAALDPAEPIGARNLALALARAGAPAAGLDSLRPALDAHPDHVGLQLALMRLLFQLDQPKPAVAALQRAIMLDPGMVRREFPAAGTVRVRDATPAAEADDKREPGSLAGLPWLDGVEIINGNTERRLKDAIARDPTDAEAYLALARVYQETGRDPLAEATVRRLLAIAPDHQMARHKLEALTGVLREPRIPDAVVRLIFDHASATFDPLLASLEYRGPALAADLLRRHAPLAEPVRVLDLGCGTGLCGPLLRDHASHLTGVDLSAGMLAKARERRVYDDLIEAEITDYLARSPDRYGIIVAADVLCYFARVETMFAGIPRILDSGGCFVFTLERMDDAESDNDVLLRRHGRYSHREAYVRATLAAAGLTIVALEEHWLRKENGVPVQALVGLVRGARSQRERRDE